MFQVCIISFFPLWSLNCMHFSCTELCYCSHQTPKRHCALLLHKKQKQQVWAFCHCHFTYFHLKCKTFFVWQRIRCVCHSGEGKNMSWKSSRVHCAHHAVFLWAESHPWSADPRLAMDKKKKSNKKESKNPWKNLPPPPQDIQTVKNCQDTLGSLSIIGDWSFKHLFCQRTKKQAEQRGVIRKASIAFSTLVLLSAFHQKN